MSEVTNAPGTLDYVPGEELDTGKWLEDPEYSDEFAPIIMLYMELNNIKVEPTMKIEEQDAAAEQGVLDLNFEKWAIHLNWSTHWADKIPPHHYAVEYAGMEMAIMSPYMYARTCWQCGLGCPRVGGTWKQNRMYVRDVYPDAPLRLPWVLPAHRCQGPLHDNRLIRTCGAIDWFAKTVPREMLQRDAQEHLAKITVDDRYAAMATLGPADPAGPGMAQDMN